MLKHVQISPHRNRSDSVSLRSTTSCASSICGSPEPPTELLRTPSRASSYSSLNETLPQTTIKVYTSCLRIDIEYKTLGIQWDTTSKEVIAQLLRRLKMRHRDPRLFYLSMEVTVRRAGVKTILVLDKEARPAILQACHPKGDSRFCLQLKPGGLIRVHTSALLSSSQYKSIVISEETTSDELLTLLLSCYNSTEPVEQFSLYEVCPGQEYQRKLHPDDLPLRAQTERIKRGETCHFLVRRNPNYPRRRQILPSITEKNSSTTTSSKSASSSSLSTSLHSITNSTNSAESDTLTNNSSNSSQNDVEIDKKSTTNNDNDEKDKNVCKMCRNNFKSCEFCHKNSSAIQKQHQQQQQQHQQQQQQQQQQKRYQQQQQLLKNQQNTLMQTYSPVYNIREIRTVSHSFSALGIDKKLLDIEIGSRFPPPLSSGGFERPRSVYLGKSRYNSSGNISSTVSNNSNSSSDCNGNTISRIDSEPVNNNPAKGLGHFVYV